MKGINEVTILGYVGNDPETHTFANSGDMISNLSIATSDTWKDANGNKQERTEWHKIVMRKRLAEIAAQYVKKGDLLLVQGALQTRKYTDSQGIDRYITEIVATSMQMLGSPNRQDNQQYEPQAQTQPQAPQQTPQVTEQRTDEPQDEQYPF